MSEKYVAYETILERDIEELIKQRDRKNQLLREAFELIGSRNLMIQLDESTFNLVEQWLKDAGGDNE